MAKKIALCLLANNRIAPRFDFAQKLVILSISQSGQFSQDKSAELNYMNALERCKLVSDLQPDILICGGVHEECRKALDQANITIVDNIIGSKEAVLEAYAQGKLCSGQIFENI